MSFRYRHEGWRKLYVREEGSFAQLPLYTRALAGQLLKLCDSQGKIACHGKEPWAAIAWRTGATRGDRRMLKRDVGLLLDDGYIVRDRQTGDLTVAAFLRAHPHLAAELEGVDQVAEPIAAGGDVHDLHPPAHLEQAVPTDAPGAAGAQMGLFDWGGLAATTTGARPVHDRATTVQRKVTQVADTPQVAIVEKRREEKSQRETPPPGVASPGSQTQIPVNPEPSWPSVTERNHLLVTAQGIADDEEMVRFQIACERNLDYTETPVADIAQRIAYLLRSGWTEDNLRRSLASFAAEARKKGTLAYFNGVDNWKPAAIRRALGRMPPQAARAPVATSTPVSEPAPARQVALDDLRATWRGMGLGPDRAAELEARYYADANTG